MKYHRVTWHFHPCKKMNSQDIIDLPDNYLIHLYIKSSQEYRWVFHNTYINTINLFKQTFYILIFLGACIQGRVKHFKTKCAQKSARVRTKNQGREAIGNNTIILLGFTDMFTEVNEVYKYTLLNLKNFCISKSVILSLLCIQYTFCSEYN